MESSSCSRESLPLFPAYSASVQNEDVKKDWLCNSSFTESTLKEVNSQLLSRQNAEAVSENSVPAIDETEVHATTNQKKSHKKRKYEKYSTLAFSVPESESILCHLKKKTFIEETGLSYERAFQTDAKGDPENLMYESFERTKIASYKPLIKIPIGLSMEELSTWLKDLPKSKEKIPLRYFSRNFLKTLKTVVIEEIQATKKESLQNLCLNYIPISRSPDHSEKSDSTNFIDVSSSWKLDSATKSVMSKDDKPEMLNNELRAETIYYNQKLSENPHNIKMWIEFVEFQDKVFSSENANCTKNLAEKKMAILEKALQHNPKNVKLNILRLKLFQELHPDKLTSMWEELVFYNPNKPEVWEEYLLYVMSNLTVFNVSNILKIYSKCVQTLANLCEGVTQSHGAGIDIVSNMLDILNQLYYILSSCGYTEKAIAICQAFIEFNLFSRPSVENLTVSEKIACFEPFWDSGAPRIGEKNACGWAKTVEQKKVSFSYFSTDSDLNSAEDEILSKNLTVARTWLEFERLRELHHWFPWRPNPEYDQTSDDVDDADRYIPFSDVSRFLFCIQEEYHKFLVVMNFIEFLGFHPHLLGCHSNKRITNPYRLEEYENILNQFRNDSLFHHLVDPFPVNTVLDEQKCNFIDNVFSQVVDAFSPRYKTLCTFIHVKFLMYCTLVLKKSETDKDIAALKKSVMKILKKTENRNCLLLWHEYIRIEWLTDKSSAMNTFQALLKSSILAVCSGDILEQELWYFVQSFIEFYMNSEKNVFNGTLFSNEILWILIHVASKEKYSPYSDQDIKSTRILKTVSRFRNALDNSLSDLTQSSLCYCFDPCSYSVLNCAKCFAYFQYLSQGCDAAIQVFESAVSFLDSRDLGHYGRYISEEMNIAQAKILNLHTWNSTSSIKPLQMFLYSSVRKYPHNSQLLYLLMKLKSASSVINPTRRFLSRVLTKHCKGHPVTWFFVLLTEVIVSSSLLRQNEDYDEDMLRGIVSNLGINWRIRSVYEKMLQLDACKNISVLWQSYFKFELMTHNVEKAKSVYHRALQNCGWSKELLMEVIEYFPDELEKILAFMTEKQLRVHTPLEEVTLLIEHVVGS